MKVKFEMEGTPSIPKPSAETVDRGARVVKKLVLAGALIGAVALGFNLYDQHNKAKAGEAECKTILASPQPSFVCGALTYTAEDLAKKPHFAGSCNAEYLYSAARKWEFCKAFGRPY